MPPFQRPLTGTLSGVEGLDIDILTQITNALKIEVNGKERSWKNQLDALENGHADMVVGAFRPEEGDDLLHYSLPYGKARGTFLVRDTDKDCHKHRDPVTLLLGDQRCRVGYIRGRLLQ